MIGIDEKHNSGMVRQQDPNKYSDADKRWCLFYSTVPRPDWVWKVIVPQIRQVGISTFLLAPFRYLYVEHIFEYFAYEHFCILFSTPI